MVNKIELFESTNTKTVRMVIKKEKLLIVNLILILSLNDKFDRNDKFVTVHNKCSKIPPATSKY